MILKSKIFTAFFMLNLISSLVFAATRLEIANPGSPKYNDFQALIPIIKGGVVQVAPDGLQTDVSTSVGSYYTSSLFFTDGSSKLAVSPLAEDTSSALNVIQNWINESNSTLGTGFFIKENLILTNAHVVKSANFVRFYPSAVTTVQDKKQWLQGRIIWRTWRYSPEFRTASVDLALIELDKVNVDRYKELLKQNSVNPYVFKATPDINSSMTGEAVATFSNPAARQGYLSVGSVVDSVTQFKDQERAADLTNATSGSSGGPLFNLKGELTGIIFAMANPEANAGLRTMFYSPIQLILDYVNSEQLPISGLGMVWFFRHFDKRAKIAETYALQTIDIIPPEFQNSERKYGMIVKDIPKDLIQDGGIKVDDLIFAIDGHKIQVQEYRSSFLNFIYLVETKNGLYSLEHYLTVNEQKSNFELTVFRNGETEPLKISIPNVIRKYSESGLNIINALNDLNVGPRYTEISGYNFVNTAEANSTLFSWLSNGLSLDFLPEDGVILNSLDQVNLSSNENLRSKNNELLYFFSTSQRIHMANNTSLQESIEHFQKVNKVYRLRQYSNQAIMKLKSFNGSIISNLEDLNFELEKSRSLGQDIAMLVFEVYQAGNEDRMAPTVELVNVPVDIGLDENGNNNVIDQLLGNIGGGN